MNGTTKGILAIAGLITVAYVAKKLGELKAGSPIEELKKEVDKSDRKTASITGANSEVGGGRHHHHAGGGYRPYPVYGGVYPYYFNPDAYCQYKDIRGRSIISRCINGNASLELANN